MKKFLNFFTEEKNEFSEFQKIKYDVYLKYRDYLVQKKHDVEDKELNLIILLSSGMFSLFFIFSKFVSPFSYIYLILIAQFLALLSLIFAFISLFFSKRAFDKQIEIHDLKYKNEAH